jgi:hypothetical protein
MTLHDTVDLGTEIKELSTQARRNFEEKKTRQNLRTGNVLG